MSPRRLGALFLGVLYWLAVLAVSLVLVAGLVLFLESRDASSLGPGAGGGGSAEDR